MPCGMSLVVQRCSSDNAKEQEEPVAVGRTMEISDCAIGATDCEWMFGDAATGFFGFNALARLNPLRWSGSCSFSQAITDIRNVQTHGSHPIVLKVPSGVLSKEQKFSDCQAAIDYLHWVVSVRLP